MNIKAENKIPQTVDQHKHELTDAANALRLAENFGSDLRFVPEWGWLTWTGKKWRRDDLAPIEMAVESARRIHAEAVHARDRDEQKAISSHATKSQSANAVRAALWLARPKLGASVDDFDRHLMILPVTNGVVDLTTGKLQRHARENFNTRLAGTEFRPGASCPTWEKFLSRVLPCPEVRAFVQRLAGYSLSGSTEEQILIFLYGSGRNGKSVFIETLATLVGDFHAAARVETLTGSSSGIPNDVAAMAGSRFVSVSETPEGGRFNESFVKDLTGSDTISARFLRAEFFSFRPQFKIWIRGNHKPQIRGTDDGIWRRLMLIPFTVQISEAEVDPSLPNRLKDELSGILNWAIAGALDWKKNGLRPPQAVATAVSEYRTESDTLGQFISECCVTHPDAKATAAALYTRYREWCSASGHFPVTSTRFGRALGERGFEKSVPKNVIWLGIDLNSDSSDSCDSSPSSTYTRAHERHEPKMGSQLSEPSEPLTKDAPGEIF